MSLQPRADRANSTDLINLTLTLENTGKWDGNDGKWSTFFLNVGDLYGNGTGRGGQNFRVLVSTSLPITQVPLEDSSCNEKCAVRRGIEPFENRQPVGLSITSEPTNFAWQRVGLFDVPLPDWWRVNIGTKVKGLWGNSHVGLGKSSKDSIVQQETVVGTSGSDLFMGTFGLETTKVSVDNAAKDTYLTYLSSGKQIASRSYGYTAGAYYKFNQRGAHGSLVLGGYDMSRKGSNGVEIPMPQLNHALTVNVQSVEYQTNGGSGQESFTASGNSGSTSFAAVIDSTLPYLWLPPDICDQFASKFQLTFDNETNFYTINDTSHEYNLEQDATVIFKIGGEQRGGDFASINLPYLAFYQPGSDPLFPNDTNYFPIRKSPSKDTYVLGRAFLQESYIVVNYENKTFSVAPAVAAEPMPSPRIVPIFQEGKGPASTPTEASSAGGGLAPGAVAGIVVGIVLLLGLLALGAFFFWKKRKGKKEPYTGEKSSHDFDTMEAGEQVKHRRVSELDSEPPYSPKQSIHGYVDSDGKSIIPFPAINEMESPGHPAELYSPPPEGMTPGSEQGDYFNGKVRRRGATRESSTGHSAPGTPGLGFLAELPGDEGRYTVDGQHFDPVVSPIQSPAMHARGASDASIPSNMDEVISPPQAKPASQNSGSQNSEELKEPPAPRTELEQSEPQQITDRRPSHTRGLSDITVNSDSTAVSQPTPEERERWAQSGRESMRPLSQ